MTHVPVAPVLAALDRYGLLLQQDKALPSVVGILTGESLDHSWWSHPEGPVIFSVLSALADHPDVLFTKLVHGKVTLVHRLLWPAVHAIGRARAPWQMRGLSTDATQLLETLDRATGPVRASGEPAKEIELRLLACARQVHTEAGSHEVALESWSAWSRRVRSRAARSVPDSRKVLEVVAEGLGAPPRALPWRERGRRGASR